MYILGLLLLFFMQLYAGNTESVDSIVQRYSNDAYLERVALQAEHYANKYTTDEFLDHVIYAEKYRKEAQAQINRGSFLSLPAFDGLLTNKDIMLGGVISIDWLVEWYFYHFFFKVFIDQVSDGLIKLPAGTIPNDKIYEQLFTDVSQKLYTKYLAVLMLYSLTVCLSDRVSRHFCLSPDGSESVVQLAQVLCSLPLPFFQQTLVHKLTYFLQEYNIIGDWIDSKILEISRQLLLITLWVRYISRHELLNHWQDWVKDKKNLVDELFKKETRDIQAIMFFVQQGTSMSFTDWLVQKQIYCAKCNTIIQGVLLIPAIYTIGSWVYNFINLVRNPENPVGDNYEKRM